MVDLHDLLDQGGTCIQPGIGGEQPWRVREQHQEVRLDQVCHERGDAVVVAEPDLVVRDGVVLVDNGHDAEFQEPVEGAAGVEVLGPHEEVQRSQEHLPGYEVVSGELALIGPDEVALTHRRHGLERDRVTWAAASTHAECRQARCDRARGDHHHPVSVGTNPGNLAAQLRHEGAVDHTLGIGDGGCPDLDHHRGTQRFAHQPSSYSNSSRPIRTISPSLTPARVNARSTPIFFSRSCR